MFNETLFMIWLQSTFSFTVPFFKTFTHLGIMDILILIFFLFYWCVDKESGKVMGLSLSVVQLWKSGLKQFFVRLRPYMVNKEIICFQPDKIGKPIYDINAQGYSFPSGHSSRIAVIFTSIANYFKKNYITVFAILVIFLIGFSRVILGDHYPTDVLAGWILGIFTFFFIDYLNKKIEKSWIVYLILFILILPGIYFMKGSYFGKIGIFLGMALGFLFDEHYINFKTTRNPSRFIIRFIVGVLIYFVINAVISSLLGEKYILGLITHLIIFFIMVAIYPLTFKYFDKYFK